VAGGGGEREGDVAMKAPAFVPGNFLTKKALDFLGVSRRSAPIALRENGFQSVGFAVKEGSVRIILHKATRGDSSSRFNRDSGNIAAVRLTSGSSHAEPELAIFDTGRASIDATRIPTPTSLDDENALVSKLAKAAPEIFKLGARAAGVPQVGGLLAAAFPIATEQARRWHGTAADESIRIADLRSSLPSRGVLFARIGRDDRELDPPTYMSGAGAPEQWQYVVTMLNTVAADVTTALNEFETTPEVKALSAAGRIITRLLVESAWERLSVRSLAAFKNGKMWPLALRLLGVDDGAAQYVRHVAEGREP
jgi:hypothetical protein